jgi:arginyl-tRNA synthetase
LLHDAAAGDAALEQLTDPYEIALLESLRQFPETVAKAGSDRAPHRIANYLRELAAALHSYYDGSQIKILGDDAALRNARLNLLAGVRQVLVNGLRLIGVSAPEKM